MELPCCLFFFSFKGNAWYLFLYEAHMYMHIHMHIYIMAVRKERTGNIIICQEIKKKGKIISVFSFILFFINYTTQRRNLTSWNIIKKKKKSFSSKKKTLEVVCEIFFFCLDSSFCLLCDATLHLLPLGKLSQLTQEIIVTGGLVLVWGHAQSQGKLTFALGPQLWLLIASHEERLQPLPPATLTYSTWTRLIPSEQPQLMPLEHLRSRRWKPREGGKKLLWLSPFLPLKSLPAAFQGCRQN